MCLLFFSYDVHPEYYLILAANRDEFYSRPSAPAAFWEDAPWILAGRDIKEGGTWMGITRAGRFAALTNYRIKPELQKVNAPSRGALVSDFLKGGESPENYLKSVMNSGLEYNGFNLIAGDLSGIWYCSNQKAGIEKLSPGIYGLSNAFIDTPWPKVEKGKAAFSEKISGEIMDEELFQVLQDKSVYPDSQLPDTGLGLEWERILSSIFISSPGYGTRSSSILMIDRKRRVRFAEKTFIPSVNNEMEDSTRIFRFWLADRMERVVGDETKESQ